MMNQDLDRELRLRLEGDNLSDTHKKIISIGNTKGQIDCKFRKETKDKELWGKMYKILHPTKGTLSKPVDEAMAANTKTIEKICDDFEDNDPLTSLANVAAS